MEDEEMDSHPPFPPIVLHIVRPGDNIETKRPGTKFDVNDKSPVTSSSNRDESDVDRAQNTNLRTENGDGDKSGAGPSSPAPKKKPKKKPKESEETPEQNQVPDFIPYDGPLRRISFESGTVALQGCRPTMEDAHVTLDKLIIEDTESHVSFYGVYDGHGGKDAALVVENHLHNSVISNQAFKEGDIKKAIGEAFTQTDAKVLEVGAVEGWKNGTTAVVVMVKGMELFVANVGDSEAVLGRKHPEPDQGGYKAVLLSEKHIASIPSEKKRILSQGGTVIFGRVFGDLVVSRAFGDSDYKPPKSESSFISCEPFYRTFPLNPDYDHFVVIACDGLWDVFKYQEAIDFVLERRKEGKSAQDISQALADEALERKSQDNTTVTVVFFKWEDLEAE